MDIISSRVRSDYNQVRFEAVLDRVWRIISGQPTELLSYEDIKAKFSIAPPTYRGIQTVKLEQIAGSLNRYQDFDRAFRPARTNTPRRWQCVDRAFYEDISLPPIVLYKVGKVYFVVDGHHRVSVARMQGQIFIDAEVRESSTKINITL